MKRGFKWFLIILAGFLLVGLVGGGVAFFMVGNASNLEEDTLGNDTIKSIKAVVDKRTVTSVSTQLSDGIKTKSIHYRSDSVQDDLRVYVQYLREEAGFHLTKDMDLSQIPSTVQMGKPSEDSGQILLLTIDYDAFGYTISLQKGRGSLTLDD